jgi:predicted YcjX-like family ATPase
MTSMADSQSKQQHSTEAAPSLSLCESSNSYAAVIENRAKEVGVAVLHLDSLKLSISQYIEAGRYVLPGSARTPPALSVSPPARWQTSMLDRGYPQHSVTDSNSPLQARNASVVITAAGAMPLLRS